MLIGPNDHLLSNDGIGANNAFVLEDSKVLAKFWDGENIPY